jgi:hypothetical protein
MAEDVPTELAQRILCPDRPRLAEARAAVAGVTDAREAWDSLAARGVIPSDWQNQKGRVFKEAEGQLFPHPPTVDACLALASDPSGIEAAESLAAEVRARLAPWGAPLPARIAWRVIDPTRLAPTKEPPLERVRAALFADRLALAEYNRAFNRARPAFKGGHYPSRGSALFHFAADAAWRVVRHTQPNPFEPLLSLWRLGYALYAIRQQGLVLLAPTTELRPSNLRLRGGLSAP